MKNQIELFNQMFHKDLKIMHGGGIPKFKRTNFIRKLEKMDLKNNASSFYM